MRLSNAPHQLAMCRTAWASAPGATWTAGQPAGAAAFVRRQAGSAGRSSTGSGAAAVSTGSTVGAPDSVQAAAPTLRTVRVPARAPLLSASVT
jgi:hypothetical protein